MELPDREAEPQFSQPISQIFSMLAVLALTAVGSYIALPRVLPVFIANPWFNGVIVFVFLIGVFACFWQVISMISSVRWIEGFAAQIPGHDMFQPPRLLAPLASLLRARGAQSQISTASTRSILDSVGTRVDEAREITRYITGLLIFLGLLGTFYGLATSVPAIVETIRSLTPKDGETGADVFVRLQSGLEEQMGGMGIAFASSLLGLAGSLIVGLLELFAGHAQNRFYQEMEEWLSTITRVGFSSGDMDGSGEASIFGEALEHMILQMDRLQTTFAESEERRTVIENQIGDLANSLNQLTAQMSRDGGAGTAMIRVAEGQERLIATLSEMHQGEGVDAESRMRLRSIDVQMLRILEEISAGRQESMSEIRQDLNALTQAIGVLSQSGKGRRRIHPGQDD
ncbi:biopolymer transporter ExbB [Cognatishimia sp. D5M38]|uniref:Biopolymer transporter ExbB n=1 Tax=Cognatishimia coralii TaxID=3083254 RepID=A0ABU8QGE0_9RHOB